MPRQAEEEIYFVARSLGVEEEKAQSLVRSVTGEIGRQFPAITMLELFLTDACNLACPYCFVEEKSSSRSMSLETAKKAFEFLVRESRGSSNLNVIFMGGEPLLRFGMLREFLPWAKERAGNDGQSVRFDMTTNGTLIDDEKAKFLAKMGCMVLVSVDGDQETHDRFRPDKSGRGSFDAALRGLGFLRRHQGYLGVKVTVVPAELPNLVTNVKKLAARGINHFIIGHATGEEWTPGEAEAMAEAQLAIHKWWRELPEEKRPRFKFIDAALKRRNHSLRYAYGCRAGRHSIAVTPEEEIFPCSKMIGADGLKGVLPLTKLTDGLVDHETRRRLAGRGAVERKACWNCAMQNRCYGGCYAVNFTLTGDPYRPSAAECRIARWVEHVHEVIRKRHGKIDAVRQDMSV